MTKEQLLLLRQEIGKNSFDEEEFIPTSRTKLLRLLNRAYSSGYW